MKHLKTYESIKNQPRKGDYVVIKVNREKYKEYSQMSDEERETFFAALERKIGKIIGIIGSRYKVEYQLAHKVDWFVTKDEIVDFSKIKENLKHLIPSGDPEKGDYVVINIKSENRIQYKSKPSLLDAIESNIGTIEGIAYDEYKVKFIFERPFGRDTHYFFFERDEILDFSKNKEDLDYYLASMKYNL